MSEGISIKVPTSVLMSYVTGRNGSYNITAVGLSDTIHGDYVYIDGYGKRDTILNGGLRIESTAMDKIALTWLKARGVIPND